MNLFPAPIISIALALVALLASVAQAQANVPKLEPLKVRRALKVGDTVSTTSDAVRLALEDARAIHDAGGDPSVTRYVWVPDWIDPTSGFRQVAHVVNSTLTRTATRPQPRLVTDDKTTLVAIDVDRWAARGDQVDELLKLYERLAPRDSWFNTEVVLAGEVLIEVDRELVAGQAVEIKLTNGQWAAATFKIRKGSLLVCEYLGKSVDCPVANVRPTKQPAPPPVRRFAAHSYLGKDGAELFALTRSDVPIMRLDEWVTFTFSSINGGLYYELVGVEKTLGETVAKFAGLDAARKVLRRAEVLRLAELLQRKEVAGGQPRRSLLEIAAELDPELTKSKAVQNHSGVTGRQRAFLFVAGGGIAPAEGLQLVAVTFDISEDNTAAASDPQRNLSQFETYNGGEAILALPNGLLLYLVFDAQDNLIASVPDNVAHDFEARKVRANASTVRVFAGASCANCHDQVDRNWGWQPVTNDIAATLRSLTQILGDRAKVKHGPDKLQELQRLAAAYGADDAQLLQMLDQARLGFQRAIGESSGALSSREVTAGLADSYWGYWYDIVSPETAVADVAGLVLTREDAQAWLIRHIEPDPDAHLHELLREDLVLDRLKRQLTAVPAQWRGIAPNVIERYVAKRAEVPVQPVLEEGK